MNIDCTCINKGKFILHRTAVSGNELAVQEVRDFLAAHDRYLGRQIGSSG